jgi:hypothetical protein
VSNAVDIGHGVTIELSREYGVEEGPPVGLTWRHPSPKTGEPCKGGFVAFAGRYMDDGWKVESDEPLTLSPSLLCRACGCHGFIRAGRWVPA